MIPNAAGSGGVTMLLGTMLMCALHLSNSEHVLAETAKRKKATSCAIHAQAYGVNLVCCSREDPLVPDCEYAPMCLVVDECSCQVSIAADLNCSSTPLEEEGEEPFQWMDHRPTRQKLGCARPNLPGNTSEIPYEVRVERWNNHSTDAFLLSLCSLNVSSLTLLDSSELLSSLDLTKCFPKLQNLEISLPKQTQLDIYQLFRSLGKLGSLRIVNVDFDFWHSVSPWTSTISYLHVENSSIRELPHWLAASLQLTRVHIKGTRLTSATTVVNMRNLKSAKLSHNLISDLAKDIFSSTGIFDIDLSYNNISRLAAHTFSHCVELRVLDLSHNPLEEIPPRAFQKSGRLKWLKLDYTRIKVLSSEHFVGLHSLRTLSLSHTPIHAVSSFSLLPLKSLRILNLNSCNLTHIPTAVIHTCQLTHLNIASNLLRTRSSLPPDVVVHLSALSQLNIEGNPLKEFPAGLLMISTMNTRLIRQTIRTLSMLPVWTSDPCTPYYFHMHLANSSKALRILVQPWNNRRMKTERLDYCRDQYEWIASHMDIYREIEKSSGCAVSRRLRSSADHCSPPKTKNISTPRPPIRSRQPAHMARTEIAEIASCAPADSSYTPLLLLSVALNVFFVLMSLVIVCLCCIAGKNAPY